MNTEQQAGLNRLKELLSQQCDSFRNYLEIFDKQQFSIESANTDDLLSYVDMEEQFICEIICIQNVIDPLENMYGSLVHEEGWNDVVKLKADLEELKQQAVYKLSRNRELLSVRMAEIRREIEVLKNNPVIAGIRRSVYNQYDTASMVDIRG